VLRTHAREWGHTHVPGDRRTHAPSQHASAATARERRHRTRMRAVATRPCAPQPSPHLSVVVATRRLDRDDGAHAAVDNGEDMAEGLGNDTEAGGCGDTVRPRTGLATVRLLEEAVDQSRSAAGWEREFERSSDGAVSDLWRRGSAEGGGIEARRRVYCVPTAFFMPTHRPMPGLSAHDILSPLRSRLQ
jgi:hypothetical protein